MKWSARARDHPSSCAPGEPRPGPGHPWRPLRCTTGLARMVRRARSPRVPCEARTPRPEPARWCRIPGWRGGSYSDRTSPRGHFPWRGLHVVSFQTVLLDQGHDLLERTACFKSALATNHKFLSGRLLRHSAPKLSLLTRGEAVQHCIRIYRVEGFLHQVAHLEPTL